MLKSSEEFRGRLQSFFKRASDLRAGRFVVEVRNKEWLDPRLTDLLRGYNVALALTDTSFMPRPWEMKGTLDLVTADFSYVRWLGNRKATEEQTTTWDKTVIEIGRSTRLNSSHGYISYAVFCLKKKTNCFLHHNEAPPRRHQP